MCHREFSRSKVRAVVAIGVLSPKIFTGSSSITRHLAFAHIIMFVRRLVSLLHKTLNRSTYLQEQTFLQAEGKAHGYRE